MITKIRMIIGIAIISLGGCTPIPVHNQQDLSVPKTTRSGVKIVNRADDLSQVLWWKKMHDLVLERLITEALERNNQLQTAAANVLQAQAKLKEAHIAWLPTLSLSGNGFIGGGWDSSVTPQGPLAASPALSKLGNIHFRGYYSGFVPNYSLNILENSYNDSFAKAALGLQKAQYQSTRLSIISQISGAYFMLLGQKEQKREQSQLVHDLRKIRRLEWIRYKEGASDNTIVTSLDAQIANNIASVTSLENSISQVENSIELLLNRNPGPLLRYGDVNTLSVEGLIPDHVPSSVLKNRPDIIMAEASLQMSESNLGIAYSHFFPTISLTGLLGAASVDLSHLLKLSTSLWLAQAAASVPILNGGYYQEVKGAKAGYCAAYYTYLQTVRSAFADVDNSLTNQHKVNSIYKNKLQALYFAQKNYDFAFARYKAGAQDYRDTLNAKITLDNAKLSLTQAKMQQLDSIVEVYQALASGYTVEVKG